MVLLWPFSSRTSRHVTVLLAGTRKLSLIFRKYETPGHARGHISYRTGMGQNLTPSPNPIWKALICLSSVEPFARENFGFMKAQSNAPIMKTCWLR